MTVVVGDAGRDMPPDRSAEAEAAVPRGAGSRPDVPDLPPGGTDDPTRAAILVSTSVIGLVRLFAGVLAVPGLFAAPDAGRSAAGLGLVVLMAAALTFRPGPLTATPVRRAALLATDLAVGGVVLAVAGFGIPCLYQSLGTAALAASLYGAQGVAVGARARHGGQRDHRLDPAVRPDRAAHRSGWSSPSPPRTRWSPSSPCSSGTCTASSSCCGSRCGTRPGGRPRRQERARLARELHDSLASTLSGIGLCAPRRAAGRRPAGPRGGTRRRHRRRGRRGRRPGARDDLRAARAGVSPDLAGTVRTTVATWSPVPARSRWRPS